MTYHLIKHIKQDIIILFSLEISSPSKSAQSPSILKKYFSILMFRVFPNRLGRVNRFTYAGFLKKNTGAFTMSDDLLKDSLRMLSQFLQKHYGQSTVMLKYHYCLCLPNSSVVLWMISFSKHGSSSPHPTDKVLLC